MFYDKFFELITHTRAKTMVVICRSTRAYAFSFFVRRGSIIPPTEEGPDPKRLVYKQLFDIFKSLLSLVFNTFTMQY